MIETSDKNENSKNPIKINIICDFDNIKEKFQEKEEQLKNLKGLNEVSVTINGGGGFKLDHMTEIAELISKHVDDDANFSCGVCVIPELIKDNALLIVINDKDFSLGPNLF